MKTRRSGPDDGASQALLKDFVAVFPVDEWYIPDEDNWRPFAHPTATSSLKILYSVLPCPLPPLYELFVLSYRWPQAELPTCQFLSNPAGEDLEGLLSQIRRDKGLWESLAPNGYIQFGRAGWGPSGDGRDGVNFYDPICFDTRHPCKDGDYPIVRIDAEEILCNWRVIVLEALAGSFRELVEANLLRHKSVETN